MAEGNPISSVIRAIRARFSGSQPTAAAAQAGSEELSKALPAAVMPREAIEKKRAQMKQVDDVLKGS